MKECSLVFQGDHFLVRKCMNHLPVAMFFFVFGAWFAVSFQGLKGANSPASEFGRWIDSMIFAETIWGVWEVFGTFFWWELREEGRKVLVERHTNKKPKGWNVVQLMEKILHQLRLIVYPSIYRFSFTSQVVQDFSHPQYVFHDTFDFCSIRIAHHCPHRSGSSQKACVILFLVEIP